MFTQAPPGEEWGWLRLLQSSYHKCTQSYIHTWLDKATSDSEKPPKAKHVRRIIVSSLRDPSITPLYITSYLIHERPWKSDCKIAAKSVYIILVNLQYQIDLSPFSQISNLTDQVVSHMMNHTPSGKSQLYADVSSRIGSIIHSKLLFHSAHPKIEGNFSMPHASKSLLKDSTLINNLRKHLIQTHYEASGVMAAVTASEDFTATVLWQPMVDETVSAYRLLKSIDNSPESETIFNDVEKMIQRLPEYPYIATTVIFPTPGEKITIPRERFPRNIMT